MRTSLRDAIVRCVVIATPRINNSVAIINKTATVVSFMVIGSNSFPCKCSPPLNKQCLCVQRDSLYHPRSCRGLPPPQRQHYRPPRPRIKACPYGWRGSIAYLVSYTPFVFFGVFPYVWVFPTPPYHMLCNYHTSFRVTPTTHSLTHSLTQPRRSLTPRKPRLTDTRDDLDDDQHPHPQPRTPNKPTPAPQKSSTSFQPRRPRRPRRRPLGATTPLNTQKSSTNKQPGDRDDGQHTRPQPRTHT